MCSCSIPSILIITGALASGASGQQAPAKSAPAPTQQRQHSTQTSTSGSDAAAESRVGVRWFSDGSWDAVDGWPGWTDGSMPNCPGIQAPVTSSSARPGGEPGTPGGWSDPRELPRPRGVGVIAFARAEAHSKSRSTSRTMSTAQNSGDTTRSGSSRSRSSASARAEAVIVAAPGAARSSNGDDARGNTPASPALAPERRARIDALRWLDQAADWRGGVVQLGRVYAEHPELLESGLLDDAAEIEPARVRMLLSRARAVATQDRAPLAWVAVGVLMHADGRAEAALATLRRAAPNTDAERDQIESVASAIRAKMPLRRSAP